MKMKSVLAAVMVAAAVSCTSVCAFAEAENTEETNAEIAAVNEAEDPIEKGNPNSGVESVAMVASIAMIAGAALVVSRKREA